MPWDQAGVGYLLALQHRQVGGTALSGPAPESAEQALPRHTRAVPGNTADDVTTWRRLSHVMVVHAPAGHRRRIATRIQPTGLLTPSVDRCAEEDLDWALRPVIDGAVAEWRINEPIRRIRFALQAAGL
ncbi:hypothetical protein [Streptomyces laurentii]|uniref:hypothetical protein n=1 Tax=Streptomyces laurentii TaxID=39478 RepID=UPI0036BD0994